MKMSENAEEEEIVDGSSSKDHKCEFKIKKPRFSIDLNRPAPVEEHPEFKMKMRDEKDMVREL